MGTRKAARVLSVVVTSVALMGGASRVVGGENAAESDLGRMQGTWVTRAGERQELCVTLEIQGSHVTVRVKTPQGLKLQGEGEIRVNETVAPRSLDWVGFTGADAIELPDILAIYELSDRTLRVCNGGPNNPRPTRFKAGEGILAGVHVFERPTEGTSGGG